MNNIILHGRSHVMGSSNNSFNSTGSNNSASFSRTREFNNEEDIQRPVTRKPRSKVEVTSYTDKEGRVHKTYTGKGTDVVENMQKSAKSTKDDRAKLKKRLNYSYQKVSNQVLMAKTSLSASRAVLAARRSLADIKRKIQTAECSEDEKQAALSHAKRLLHIATKKKKNLEMEELIHKTMESDEQNDKNYEASEDTALDYDYEEFDDTTQDENEGTSEEMNELQEFADSDIDYEQIISDNSEKIAPEMLEEFNEIFDELSEDFLNDMSEEIRDMMDLLEVVNPHMDEEHFEKLKTKHRCDEQKELVKADMDYLKEYIRIVNEGPQVSNPCEGVAIENSDMSLGFTASI